MPTLVWLADPDGVVVHLSRRWLQYTGLSAQEAGGWGWATAVHQDDVDRLTEYWRTVVASGAPGEIEARLRRCDGQHRWFLFCAAPLQDASGDVAGWCATQVDIEDRKQADDCGGRANDS